MTEEQEKETKPMKFVRKANALRARGATEEQWQFATLLGEACEIIKSLIAEKQVQVERIEKLEAGIQKCLNAWRTDNASAEKEWLEQALT